MENLQSELREYLENDEFLIWTGKPKSGFLLRTSDFYTIPFSIFWCGFIAFWMNGALNASWIFAIFGVPFVLAGLHMVFGRFLVDIIKRKNTVYGLTENRIIIRSGIFFKSVRSLNLGMMDDLELSEKNDGTGTISVRSEPQLEFIKNARKVYSQIIDIQNRK